MFIVIDLWANKYTSDIEDFSSHICIAVDGDLSVNKLVFMNTRAYKKDAASLIASGPRGHIHFWNVFQGGKLMSQFLVVSPETVWSILKNTLERNLKKNCTLQVVSFCSSLSINVFFNFINSKLC